MDLCVIYSRSKYLLCERHGPTSEANGICVYLCGLIGLLDGHDEEVEEPGERVLVHGVDVGEVGYREEQYRRVDGDRLVGHSRRVDLLLGLLGNRLLVRDLVRQRLRRR